MSVDYSVFIMIGVNHSILTLDHMICSMLTLYSQHLRKSMFSNFKNCQPRNLFSPYASFWFSWRIFGFRCNILAVIAEVDRILRPEGYLVIRDNVETIGEIESMAKSLHWDIRLTYSKNGEGFLCIQKTFWRPTKVETVASAIAWLGGFSFTISTRLAHSFVLAEYVFFYFYGCITSIKEWHIYFSM